MNDRERAAGHVRGPLHGIPIALKDNIHSINLPTSEARSRSMASFHVRGDAHQESDCGWCDHHRESRSLRARGYVAGAPTPAPGTTTRLGQGYNPHDPRRDPRPDTADAGRR